MPELCFIFFIVAHTQKQFKNAGIVVNDQIVKTHTEYSANILLNLMINPFTPDF